MSEIGEKIARIIYSLALIFSITGLLVSTIAGNILYFPLLVVLVVVSVVGLIMLGKKGGGKNGK